MKKLITFIVAALFFGTGSVYAEANYFGIGTGLQFNLGSLGQTIASSGLDSAQQSRSSLSTSGALCQNGVDPSNTTLLTACKATGSTQQLIVPENKLIAIEKGTGQLVRAHVGGPMTGLMLELFYEHQGDGTFWRVGLQHIRRVSGGRTRATILEGTPLEQEWLKHEWDYYAWHIPFYYGLNINVSDSGSVYAGAGLNYSQGGWNLGGSIYGDLLAEVTKGAVVAGPHSSVNPTGTVAGQNVYKEAAKFRVKGLGFNYVIGVDKKLASGAKLYFEIETLVNGKQGITVTKSRGGRAGLGGVTAYPINLSGTRYKFGYKMPI